MHWSIPEDESCGCGHRVKWFIEAKPSDLDCSLGYDNGLHMEKDVIEVPCPHENGTHIELCPHCAHQVGMWGVGPAGSMDCGCWE